MVYLADAILSRYSPLRPTQGFLYPLTSWDLSSAKVSTGCKLLAVNWALSYNHSLPNGQASHVMLARLPSLAVLVLMLFYGLSTSLPCSLERATFALQLSD